MRMASSFQDTNEAGTTELVSLLKPTKSIRKYPNNATAPNKMNTPTDQPIIQGKKTRQPKQSARQTMNVNSSAATTSIAIVKITTKKQPKPRRRVATVAQRRAANIRERRRMFNLNSAFDRLRKKVPSFAYEKRLSRIETLKLAIMYIKFMDDLVHDDAYAEKYKRLIAQQASDPTANNFMTSAAYLSLYGHCHSSSPSPTGPSQMSVQQTRTQPSVYVPLRQVDCYSGKSESAQAASLSDLKLSTGRRRFNESASDCLPRGGVEYNTCKNEPIQHTSPTTTYCSDINCPVQPQEHHQQQHQRHLLTTSTTKRANLIPSAGSLSSPTTNYSSSASSLSPATTSSPVSISQQHQSSGNRTSDLMQVYYAPQFGYNTASAAADQSHLYSSTVKRDPGHETQDKITYYNMTNGSVNHSEQLNHEQSGERDQHHQQNEQRQQAHVGASCRYLPPVMTHPLHQQPPPLPPQSTSGNPMAASEYQQSQPQQYSGLPSSVHQADQQFHHSYILEQPSHQSHHYLDECHHQQHYSGTLHSLEAR